MSNVGAERPKRLFLTGGWGYGNRGDDAILAGTLAGLAENEIEVDLQLTSFSPEETKTQHGIDSDPSIHSLINWRRPRSLLRSTSVKLWRRGLSPLPKAIRRQAEAMTEADLIVFGGGGYFNEVWKEAYPARKLELELARDSGTPYMLLGQTFGPFSDETARGELSALLADATAASYRDLGSARVLEIAGLPPERLSYTADLAHLINPQPDPGDPAGKQRIGMTFQNHRPYGSPEGLVPFGKLDTPAKYEAAVLETIRGLSALPGTELELIPSTTWDEPFMLQLQRSAREFGVEVELRSVEQETAGFIHSCQSVDVFVSTNMHPIILASTAGIPAIALTYNFKLDDYMRRIGRSDVCFRLDDFEPASIIESARVALGTSRPDPDLEIPIQTAVNEAKNSVDLISSFLGHAPEQTSN